MTPKNKKKGIKDCGTTDLDEDGETRKKGMSRKTSFLGKHSIGIRIVTNKSIMSISITKKNTSDIRQNTTKWMQHVIFELMIKNSKYGD